MISTVAEMYEIHPQTLRLYEREGLLKPSRTEGNTRLYTENDLKRLEVILSLARDLGVNISGIAVILQLRERMEEMQRQMQEFVNFVGKEVMARRDAPDPRRYGSAGHPATARLPPPQNAARERTAGWRCRQESTASAVLAETSSGPRTPRALTSTGSSVRPSSPS